MFAGLALESGSESDESGSSEVEVKVPAPPPKPAPAAKRRPAASLLPEADASSSDADDAEPLDARVAQVAQSRGSVLGGIDPDDLVVTIETLAAISKDLTLFRSKPFKALRDAMGPLARELVGAAEGGGGRDRRGRGARAGGGDGGKRHGSRLDGLDPTERFKQMDRDALNHRVLRAERLARLEASTREDEGGGAMLRLGLSEDGDASLNAAQGESITPFAAPAAGGGAGAAPGGLADGPALAALSASAGAAAPEAEAAKLHLARSCYICKRPYRTLHSFYASLCPSCAELNWTKRGEVCNLRGRVALVTGGRVKIGLRIALKLLRCGATVIVTTRFPVDGVRRFAAEHDAEVWKDRLHLVGADFRDLQGLEALCAALPKLVPRLDIIINNACQTVRRPPQYYLPLLEAERTVAAHEEEAVRRWTAAQQAVTAITASAAAEAEAARPSLEGGGAEGGAAAEGGAEGSIQRRSAPGAAAAPETILPGMSLPAGAVGAAGGVAAAAALSQVAVVPGDATPDATAFPAGRRDGNSDLGQQLDLRARNSWMLKLEDVSTPEMAEVLAINALAPAVINGKLRPFMEQSTQQPPQMPQG